MTPIGSPGQHYSCCAILTCNERRESEGKDREHQSLCHRPVLQAAEGGSQTVAQKVPETGRPISHGERLPSPYRCPAETGWERARAGMEDHVQPPRAASGSIQRDCQFASLEKSG